MIDSQYVEDLKNRFNGGEPLKYLFFWGHRPGKNAISSSCFSQWYEAPFAVDGRVYRTAEHFMMAAKAELFNDEAIRAQVMDASTPGAAKALGRQVRGFDDAVWTKHRYAIVVRANEAKFANNPELGRFLQQTGDHILVEASPVDPVWGIGLAQADQRCSNPNDWAGLNLLGFALMQVRANQRADLTDA